jgi:TfoX/Sxy family transcriptional regulator of competence genes
MVGSVALHFSVNVAWSSNPWRYFSWHKRNAFGGSPGAGSMAYNEKLAGRVREVLKESTGITEKKMFGGLCFLLDGKMICGVRNEDLIAKIGKDSHENIATLKHVRPFDLTGRPMKGIVYVAQAGLKTKKELTKWIEMGKEMHGCRWINGANRLDYGVSTTGAMASCYGDGP